VVVEEAGQLLPSSIVKMFGLDVREGEVAEADIYINWWRYPLPL